MTERTMDVDGTKIFVRDEGSGPPILMLHGWPQTGYCWRHVAAALADDFRVVVPDVPGFGRSDAPPEHDAGVVADILARMLDQLEVDTATVVGHDWGGAFSFRMALDRPEKVERLIVSNAPFREMKLTRAWYIMFFNLPLIPELAFRVAGDRMIDFVYKVATPREGVFDDATIEVYREAYRDPERVRSALAYYRTVTRKAVAKQLGRRDETMPTALEGDSGRRITAPTLLIWGMKDPVVVPSLIPGIRRDIPQAEIVEIADAGHFVPEERPAEFAEAVERFCS